MSDSPSSGSVAVRHADALRLAGSVIGQGMLTLRGIAAKLAVDYRTVQKWRAEGTLPPADFAIGKVVRWRPETVERFIRGRGTAADGRGNRHE